MIDGPFEPPLRVQAGDPNTSRKVTSLQDACEVLIDWPHARRGEYYEAARTVVEAAQRGEKTVAEAYHAFAELCEHAGVLVRVSATST